MSLFGALSLGASSLAAQQTGLQVTGNNISNAGTEGYTRETVRLTPGGGTQVAPGQFMGTGVNVSSIERQASAAINESLRDANSDLTSSQALNTLLGRVESTFGTLNDNDLSSRLSSFFGDVSTLQTNPADAAQRSVVIQDGVSISGYLQDLRSKLSAIQTDAQKQVQANVTQANALCTTIANLNQQIAQSEGGSGGNNTLRDQRDQALSQLSQLMDIRVIEQGPTGATVNVLVGSMPLVQGNTTRGVSYKTVTDPATKALTTQVTFADNGDDLSATGGTIGGLLTAQNAYVVPAIQAVDTMAAGLINAVNTIHTQGQGTVGFSTATATTSVTDPTAALNAGNAATGITFTPRNGTFNLYLTDAATGQVTTRQITVNLSGNGTQTSLNSLASSITAAGSGTVSATVDPAGKLVISSNNSNVTFGFGEDTSGVLAAVGINTFFAGKDANDIAVNAALVNNPNLLAAGRNNVKGSNDNLKLLAGAASSSQALLGNISLNEFYTNYVGNLAAHAKNAADDVTARSAIKDTLFAQQQAISGVSLDEEAINLTKYQRAFQGTAKFITTVDELMQTVLSLVH